MLMTIIFKKLPTGLIDGAVGARSGLDNRFFSEECRKGAPTAPYASAAFNRSFSKTAP
jgi:hypothetical protein